MRKDSVDGGRGLGAVLLVACVGLSCAVLAFHSSPSLPASRTSLLQSDFPLGGKKVETRSADGKPCWSCPCCHGCHSSKEAKAAGCEKYRSVEQLVKDAWNKQAGRVGFSRTADAAERRFQGLKRLDDSLPLFDHNKTIEAQKESFELVPGWKQIGSPPHNGSFDNVIGDQFDVFRNLKDGEGSVTLHKDPAGVMVEEPAKIVPWMYAEGTHWDSDSPEEPDYPEEGTSYENSEGKMLREGKMSHGKHKTWKEIPDKQWGWEHQFANWDPDSNANKELVFGAGGLHQTGLEANGDTRKTEDTYDDEYTPWELSFMDPRMRGDDFVEKKKIKNQLDPKFKNPVNNQFWDWEESGDKNQNLVFGENKQNGGMLRQRTKEAVKDNWNFASDSKVDAEDVKDLLAHRSVGVVLPKTGEPVSDLVDGAWAFGNGVDAAHHVFGESAGDEEAEESVGGDKQVAADNAGEAMGGFFSDKK